MFYEMNLSVDKLKKKNQLINNIMAIVVLLNDFLRKIMI